MANYTTLIAAKTVDGSIRQWLNHAALPATTILEEAQALIYDALRTREMLTESTLTFAVDDHEVALPARFLDPVRLLPYGWSDGLPFVHEALLARIRDTDGELFSGTPSEWAIWDEKIKLDTKCSEEFVCDLLFYQRPAVLAVTTNETNFLTERFPSLLRYACMAKGCEFLKRYQEASGYLQSVEAAIIKANASSDMGRRGQILRRGAGHG